MAENFLSLQHMLSNQSCCFPARAEDLRMQNDQLILQASGKYLEVKASQMHFPNLPQCPFSFKA